MVTVVARKEPRLIYANPASTSTSTGTDASAYLTILPAAVWPRSSEARNRRCHDQKILCMHSEPTAAAVAIADAAAARAPQTGQLASTKKGLPSRYHAMEHDSTRPEQEISGVAKAYPDWSQAAK